MQRLNAVYTAGLVISGMLATSVHAQDQSPLSDKDKDAALEEIVVVSALRTGRSAQDSPATVAIISGSQLQASGITSLDDLRTVTSGIDLSRNNERSPVVTVRGLGSGLGATTFDPSVGLFVDGIYAPRHREFMSALFDVERMEVIKGTQTAALGLNTSLGAINLVTRKPGRELAASMSVSHELELGSTITDAAVDLPIGEKLAFRIAVQNSHLGGWVTDRITGEQAVESDSNRARITVVWDVLENLNVVGSAEIEDYVSRGYAGEVLATNRTFANGVAAQAGYPGVIGYELNYQNAMYSPALGAKPESPIHTHRGRLEANYSLGQLDLQSVTGYSYYDVIGRSNLSYLPGNTNYVYTPASAEQVMQEVTVRSPSTQTLSFLLGGSYLSTSIFYGTTAYFDYLSPFPPGGRIGATDLRFNQDGTTLSAFGQLDWRLFDAWTLIGALRETHQRKSAVFERSVVLPGNAITLAPPVAPTPLAEDESHLDGNLTLQYHWDERSNLYASYGKGSKGGGFSAVARFPSEAHYGTEIARTWEVGLKSKDVIPHLTVDVAGFRTQVDGFQISVPGVANTFTFVGLNLESTGVDLQATWNSPTGLLLSTSLTYADAKNQQNGMGIPRAPKWTALVSAEYTRPLNSAWNWSMGANVDYRSEMYQYIVGVQAPVPNSNSLARANADFGFDRVAGSPLQLRVIGRNLNNARSFGYAQAVGVAPPGTTFVAIPEQPRTVEVQLSVKF
jgi:iron complex outermembrane recepter protein